MKNFIQPGKSLDFVVPAGGCTSGVGVLIGAMFLVAAVTAAAGATAAGDREGVFELAATAHATAQPMTAFVTPVYWDDATKKVTVTAAGNQLIGVATANKDSTATTAKILLLPRLIAAGAAIADIALAAVAGNPAVLNDAATKVDVDARLATVKTKVDAIIAALRAAGVVVA